MTVRLPAGLDAFTGFTDGDDRTVEVAGDDLRSVVAAVEAALPGVAGHLVDGRGALRPHLLCLADGTATRDVDAPVGDEVRFLTAVSGG